MSRTPPNHGTYQTWYEGKSLAVEVQGTNVRDVEQMTSKPPAHWSNHPDVKTHVENPRSTKLGDVIVDPTCGAWEVQEDRFLAVPPPGPVGDRMRREGIVPEHLQPLREWLGQGFEAAGASQRPRSPSDIAREGRPDDRERAGPETRTPSAIARERGTGKSGPERTAKNDNHHGR